MVTDTFGKRLRVLRKSRAMTQDALGELVGVSGRQIGHYETDRSTPTREMLIGLATTLGVPVMALIPSMQSDSAGVETRARAKSPAQRMMNRMLENEFARGGAEKEQPKRAGQPKRAKPTAASPQTETETLYQIANRVCEGRVCEDCVLGRDRSETERLCAILAKAPNLEADIRALYAWATVNPPKPIQTYQTDFLEKHPCAPRHGDGYPKALFSTVYIVCADKQGELRRIAEPQRWDKPLGYWER